MDGISSEDYDRNYTDKALVKRIISYLKPETKRVIAVVGAIVLSSVLGTALPIVISRAIDQISASPNIENLSTIDTITKLVTTILLLNIFIWGLNAVRGAVGGKGIGNIVLKMRDDAFSALMHHDLSFYDQYPTGKIVSRVASDTESFAQVVELITDAISQFLMVGLVLLYLTTVDPFLTLVTSCLIPVLVVVALAFRKIARSTVTQARRAIANVTAHVHETISGISVAKSFRKEQLMYDEFTRINKQSFTHSWRAGLVFSSVLPLLFTITGVATAILAFVGGQRTETTALTIGEWYLFIQGVGLLWWPITSIASFWSQFQLGLAAGERVFALIDTKPKVTQNGNLIAQDLTGEINITDINFYYKKGEPVFKNFSLSIKPGETVALVGHTGSGKSSITKLLARFYEYQKGEILIDQTDIRLFNLDSYRSQIGFVTQTPFLFNGSVADNIRYGTPKSSSKEIRNVASRVGQGDWITTLEDGLETKVSERGKNLSLGQRQLISLARVLLQDPTIIILDEATASVDPLTEALIQEGLDEVLQERTAIIVAHRLSTIKNSDRIIVLQEGKVIEEGTHQYLLKNKGHYSDLYNTYFRHQSLEYVNSNLSNR